MSMLNHTAAITSHTLAIAHNRPTAGTKLAGSRVSIDLSTPSVVPAHAQLQNSAATREYRDVNGSTDWSSFKPPIEGTVCAPPKRYPLVILFNIFAQCI